MKRANIDWELVRDRLRASQRALEEALTASPERIAAAYRERAIRLADREAAQGPTSPGVPVLTFRLAQEHYAIALEELAETVAFAHCSPVPGSSPNVLGVIDLRGELRPVLDLRRLLALPEDGKSDSGFVLVLRRRGQEIGLKVDGIEELREIRREELSAAGQASYVKGIASETLMLLNVEELLAGVFSKEESLSK